MQGWEKESSVARDCENAALWVQPEAGLRESEPVGPPPHRTAVKSRLAAPQLPEQVSGVSPVSAEGFGELRMVVDASPDVLKSNLGQGCTKMLRDLGEFWVFSRPVGNAFRELRSEVMCDGWKAVLPLLQRSERTTGSQNKGGSHGSILRIGRGFSQPDSLCYKRGSDDKTGENCSHWLAPLRRKPAENRGWSRTARPVFEIRQATRPRDSNWGRMPDSSVGRDLRCFTAFLLWLHEARPCARPRFAGWNSACRV